MSKDAPLSARPSSASSPTWQAEVPYRKPVDSEHEYLRKFVDPVLMPMIEAILLAQPHSIYEFIYQYVSDENPTSTTSKSSTVFTKKIVNRRKMVDFMSTNVIPVMDDLARQILKKKPSSVKDLIKEIVSSHLLVGNEDGASDDPNDANQYVDEKIEYKVGDRVECRFKGRPRYIPGVIQQVHASNDSFVVLYEDGKIENNVHRMWLRLPVAVVEKIQTIESSNQSSPDFVQESSSTMTSTSTCTNEQSYYTEMALKMVILMIGIDGAGKSTLLSTLQGDFDKEHVPSAGFTSATFEIEKNGTATFYDLGGGPAFRNVWKEYYPDAHGIIYVMDSSCQDSFDLNAKILEESMKNPQLKEKPLLIFANKQDRVTSNFSLKEIENKLQLNEKKYGNSCQLFSCSAKNTSKNHQKIDEKIEKGLEWLFEEIQQNFHTLDERVKKDVKEKKEQNEKRKIEQRARVATWKEERERNQMSQHDIPQYRYPSMMMKTITSEDDGVVMKCSNCNTKPAETKCAASKWMPVCSDCAIILKAQAAKEAEAAVASQANAIKCTNCTIKPAETKCAASKWMPVCGDCATELRNKAATAATVPLETNK